MLYNTTNELKKIKIINIILYLEEIEFVKIFLAWNGKNSI
jgi:hypothetical protein